MKPMSLSLTVVLSVSLLPGLFAAPYDHSAKAQDTLCDLFPCTDICAAGQIDCTPKATARDTYMVAQTQQLVFEYCEHFRCTPFGCGPWPPPEGIESCAERQPQDAVKEQRQGHAAKVYPAPPGHKTLLRWLKQKSTYDTTFGDNDQFTDKDSLQEKLFEQLLSARRSATEV